LPFTISGTEMEAGPTLTGQTPTHSKCPQ